MFNHTYSCRAGRMAKNLPIFSLEEVAQHNKPDDCWMIIHGKVLNVTGYGERHPGGARLILRHAGKDGTRDFEALYHSARARKIVEDLQIGVLDAGAAAQLAANLKLPRGRRQAAPKEERRQGGIVGVVQLDGLPALRLANRLDPQGRQAQQPDAIPQARRRAGVLPDVPPFGAAVAASADPDPAAP